MAKNNFPNISPEQADNIVDLVRDTFGPEISKLMDKHGLNMNHFVRFLCISKLCQKKREEKGLSFKDVSTQLRRQRHKYF